MGRQGQLIQKGDQDWDRIGITMNFRLRKIPYEIKKYLMYHCENVYHQGQGKLW